MQIFIYSAYRFIKSCFSIAAHKESMEKDKGFHPRKKTANRKGKKQTTHVKLYYKIHKVIAWADRNLTVGRSSTGLVQTLPGLTRLKLNP